MRDASGRFIKGHKSLMTAEAAKKVSATAKKNGVGKWMKGRKFPPETIQKMRGRKNHSVPHSEETKRKMSELKKGSKHNRWIPDRTTLKPRDDRRNGAHDFWSREVKNRDYWRCKISDVFCSGRLESHHILPYRDYPELRYEVENGITLCHFHHPRKKEDEEKLISFFKELVKGKG